MPSQLAQCDGGEGSSESGGKGSGGHGGGEGGGDRRDWSEAARAAVKALSCEGSFEGSGNEGRER